MSQDQIVAALAPVVDAFDDLRVGYYVAGSVASSALGLPRTTIDVDLVADLSAHHVGPLAGRLEAEYYLNAETLSVAVREREAFNLIHLGTMLKLDVFVLKAAAYDQTAFLRARKRTLFPEAGEREFVLASAEDVALHKLHWYELGGRVSERQWGDVVGVLRVQGDQLDLDYMTRWARQLEVEDLLNTALEQAQLR